MNLARTVHPNHCLKVEIKQKTLKMLFQSKQWEVNAKRHDGEWFSAEELLSGCVYTELNKHKWKSSIWNQENTIL